MSFQHMGHCRRGRLEFVLPALYHLSALVHLQDASQVIKRKLCRQVLVLRHRPVGRLMFNLQSYGIGFSSYGLQLPLARYRCQTPCLISQI